MIKSFFVTAGVSLILGIAAPILAIGAMAGLWGIVTLGNHLSVSH